MDEFDDMGSDRVESVRDKVLATGGNGDSMDESHDPKVDAVATVGSASNSAIPPNVR